MCNLHRMMTHDKVSLFHVIGTDTEIHLLVREGQCIQTRVLSIGDSSPKLIAP